MNFIRANIVFTIIMSLALLGAIYLIYLDISIHSVITEANRVTKESNEQFERSLRGGKNRPGDLNVKMINEDSRILTGKVKSLQRIFGNTYRNAMLKFASAVNCSEDELHIWLKEICDDEKNKMKSTEGLIKLLLDKIVQEKKLKIEKVSELFRKNFIDEAQKRTVEDVDENKGYVFLGLALGLPRRMTPTNARERLNQTQGQMLLQYMIPGVKKLSRVQEFTYSEFVEKTPSGQQVEDILEMLPVFEDIFRFRMKESGLSDVLSFSRESDVPGVVSEVYREYKFKTEVAGSIDSVRKFVRLLLDAYKDNHVYVINWVSIVAKDSVKEIENLKSKLPESMEDSDEFDLSSLRTREQKRNARSSKSSRRRRSSSSSSSSKKKAFTAVKDPASKEYGKVLIGADRNVTATIHFSYFIYVGERINRNKN